MKKQRIFPVIFLMPLVVASLAITVGCQNPDSVSQDLQTSVLPDTSASDPNNPDSPTQAEDPQDPGAPPSPPSYAITALIYNGTGVSTSDWQTTEQIVKSQGWSYQLVNSSQMNAMSLDQIAGFGVIIVPGGYGGTITSNLNTATRLRIRQAVRERGVSYVGFCAGAWIAVGSEAEGNQVASYGLAVAKGNILGAYYPGGDTSLTADMVPVTFANGNIRHLVWWGGPYTPEWTNGVVARYENGKPAISETVSGKGYVVISGPHPEAPQGWRASAGPDADGLDYDIAIDMIEAALKHQPLPTY